MPLNAQLQLESLDGRWLPNATPTTPPPPTVVTSTVPPELALDADYLKDLADLRKSVDSLHELVLDYAKNVHDLRAASARVTELQAQVNSATGPVDPALLRELRDAIAEQAVQQGKNIDLAAGYGVLVKSIKDQIDEIEDNYGVTIPGSIPALGSMVDIIGVGDFPPLPPGVG